VQTAKAYERLGRLGVRLIGAGGKEARA